jgi:hypothetical protein
MSEFEIPLAIALAGAAFLAFDNRRELRRWIAAKRAGAAAVRNARRG